MPLVTRRKGRGSPEDLAVFWSERWDDDDEDTGPVTGEDTTKLMLREWQYRRPSLFGNGMNDFP